MYPTIQKRFLRYSYAAIKRYGDNKWTAHTGIIEINPAYTVSAGECERYGFGDAHDKPYIFELSNGTKFIAFINDCVGDDEVLSEYDEHANSLAKKSLHENVKNNIHRLNTPYHGHTH